MKVTVDHILKADNSEIWYQSGHPKWFEGPKERPAQTAAEAKKQTSSVLKLLKKHEKGRSRVSALADKIRSCVPGDRCTSGACPQCDRAFQRWYTKSVSIFLEKRPYFIAQAHIVPPTTRIPEKRLNSFVFRTTNRIVKQAMLKTGVKVAIGGCDISLNEDKMLSFKPHWQPHVVAFVSRKYLRRQKSKALRQEFSKKDPVLKPVMIKAFDGDLKGIAYAMKMNFTRRVTLPKLSLKSGVTKRRRNTRERLLRASQRVKLMLAQDKAGFLARIFLHGVCIVPGVKWPIFRVGSARK